VPCLAAAAGCAVSEPQGVGEILRVQARERPHALALRYLDRDTTWRELDRRANQVAHALLAEGVRPGGRIAVYGRNSDCYVELLFGAAKLGCALTALNWRLAAREIAAVLEDLDAELLFASEEFLPAIEAIRPQLRLPRIVCCESEVGGLASYRSWRDRHPCEDPRAPVSPGDILKVVYTSGTTGRPKGAMMSHANLLSVGRIYEESGERCYQLAEGEPFLAYHPFFHNAASLVIWFATRGAPTVVLPDFDPGQIVDLVGKLSVRRLALVPTMMRMLLEAPQTRGADLSSLEYVVYGASPITSELRARAMERLGVGFIQQYGMTEAVGLATYLLPRDHQGEKLATVGTPFPSLQLAILDETGRRLPSDSVGEVALRGPNIVSGYWRNPDAWSAANRDGWFRTGDAGQLDSDGYLHLKDRIKDMIISGGENVYSVEVELALSDHPDVVEAAVVGVPDERWGETVKAYVVREPGSALGDDELMDFLQGRLARYKQPRRIEFVDELPRNAIGKVLKRDLRQAGGALSA